jgi:hypothetical protein
VSAATGATIWATVIQEAAAPPRSREADGEEEATPAMFTATEISE